MEEINELVEQRLKKLEDLRAMGIDPYNGRFAPASKAADIHAQYNDVTKEELESREECTSVAGRIVAMRDFGKACFAHIQDASGRMQVYFRKDLLGEQYDLLKKLDLGDIIGAEGKLFRTRTNELTLELKDFVFLSKSLTPLPEKWHGLKDIEMRYRQRYVDLIVNPPVKDIF
ncbi:MAG: OB-fold nucleic acid binding domain-containing protein, partial [Thermodesulfovibrionales bacterium]